MATTRKHRLYLTFKTAVLSSVLLCSLALQSWGATIAFTGSGTNSASGLNLSAQAVFTYNGGVTLTLDLKNTSVDGAKVPSDVLTSVFFNLNTPNTVSAVSALLPIGSVVLNPPPTYDLGKEWAFATGISGPGGTNTGVGSSGLGIFGAGNFIVPGNPTDGMNYGIVSFIRPDANPAASSGTFVDDTMQFTFAVGAGFSLAHISGLNFQYGTDLSEPNIPGGPPPGTPVPEPGTIALLASAGVSSIFAKAKFRKKR